MKTNYIFEFLDKSKVSEILPSLFDILYDNMEKIAPFDKSFEQAKLEWTQQVAPAMKKDTRQLVLMYNNNTLVGYAQYYTNKTIFMIEEIQLKSKYQRTLLLYEFCRYMKSILPNQITYIEAYADKRNVNSQKLMQDLNMKIINDDGKYYHFQGFINKAKI